MNLNPVQLEDKEKQRRDCILAGMGSSRGRKYNFSNGVIIFNPEYQLSSEQLEFNKIPGIRKNPEIQGILDCILTNSIPIAKEISFLVMSYVTTDIIEVNHTIAEKMYRDEACDRLKYTAASHFLTARSPCSFFPWMNTSDKNAKKLVEKIQAESSEENIMGIIKREAYCPKRNVHDPAPEAARSFLRKTM